jgi:hypothetical protein
MKCDTVAANLDAIRAAESLPDGQLAACRRHIDRCPDCQDALRGTAAMAMLREVRPPSAPEDLFSRVGDRIGSVPVRRRRPGFVAGTGFGGAVAASLVTLAIAVGWLGTPPPGPAGQPGVAEFRAALGEPRDLDLAIEVDRALEGADISVLLSDGVELAGYGKTRELSWKTNLEAGVNRLSLPVIGLAPGGGQVVVRLRHPETEKMFVVNLNTDA